MALEGCDIIIAGRSPLNTKEYIDKAIDDNIKIQNDIKNLEYKKVLIQRRDKIKKITNEED